MGAPCKLMITQENRFAQPQNQAGLLSNRSMQQKHETCPQTIKQWWHETHILPNELSQLMIPRTCSSAHTKNKNIRKGWHYIKTWNDLPYFSICYCLFAHFHCSITVPAWPCRDKKTHPPDVEEELMMEACVYSRMRKKVVFSLSPLFLWL